MNTFEDIKEIISKHKEGIRQKYGVVIIFFR
jgi:hypothetical protein